MKIRTRLELLVGIAVVAMFCIGGFGYKGIQQGRSAIDDIGANRLPSVTALLTVKEALTDMSRNLYTLIVAAGIPNVETQKSEMKVAYQRRVDALKRAEDSIKAYEALPFDEEEKALWGNFKKAWGDWLPLEMEILAANKKAIDTPTPENIKLAADAHLAMVAKRRPITRELGLSLQADIDLNNKRAQEAYQEADKSAATAVKAQIAVFSAGLIALIVLGLLTLRGVMRPIAIAERTISEIAKNSDLTKQIEYSAPDEIGSMIKGLNSMLMVLHHSMTEIRTTMDDVKGAVSGMATAAAQVASSSAQQSNAASAMAASVEEMTVSISTVSDGAEEASRLATSSLDASTEGGKIIQSTVSEMKAIGDLINSAAEVIASLGEESKQIATVVNVIKEIADQTNLLALNAAIEAARAGETGRGFAVVADEVRKLAERTGQSTGDISRIVETIQSSSSKAVGEMQVMVTRIASGQELANRAGEHVSEIQEAVVKVSEAVSEINGALKEQATATQEIARHVENVAQMTDENNAASQNSAESAKQVDAMASNVMTIVGKFRV
ncbi:MAG: methyl-accepting chemotaxis protein [Betaproteobacteria bacterium]